MLSSDTDLQQLGVELFARTAAQMRKTGQVLLSAKDTATAKLVRDQVLPAFRRLSRGLAPATAGTTDAEALGLDFDSQEARPVSVAPKAAKWSVFGLAACQDTSSTKRELEDLADELAGSLDPAAADTAPKLQALSVIGRLLPGTHANTAPLDAKLNQPLNHKPTCFVTNMPSQSTLGACQDGITLASLGLHQDHHHRHHLTHHHLPVAFTILYCAVPMQRPCRGTWRPCCTL